MRVRILPMALCWGLSSSSLGAGRQELVKPQKARGEFEAYKKPGKVNMSVGRASRHFIKDLHRFAICGCMPLTPIGTVAGLRS